MRARWRGNASSKDRGQLGLLHPGKQSQRAGSRSTRGVIDQGFLSGFPPKISFGKLVAQRKSRVFDETQPETASSAFSTLATGQAANKNANT
jgi:hypothetical protein